MKITKAQAKQQKLKHFFSGKPCARGHIDQRYVSTGQCVSCVRMHASTTYHTKLKHDPKYKQKALQRATEQHKRHGTKWYAANKERASQQNKQWIKAHKDEFDEYCKKWRRSNLSKLSKNAAAYRAQKIKATPSWMCEFQVQKFYDEAHRLTLETGVIHTVDHIVPLNSPYVCGLHHQGNLQILTLSQNSSKKHLRWEGK